MKNAVQSLLSPLAVLVSSLAVAWLGCASPALAAPRVVRDVTFARVDTAKPRDGAKPGNTAKPENPAELKLDVYLPEKGRTPLGLIVWVHGGAWRAGSKDSVDLLGLAERGWALASVDYRLSTVARFPAQVHDIKGAIRYLRAHAAEYGFPPSRVIVAGSSAGAHLAALVGVSNGSAELEGNVGGNADQSSDVQAIVSLYGASNLLSILEQSTPHGLSVRKPALDLLLGGQPEAVPELARLASPVTHVSAGDPPLLMLHGDQDNQMPINQSHELEGAYQKLGLPVRFVVVHGAGHGGPAFTTDENLDLIDTFLRQKLGAAPARAER